MVSSQQGDVRWILQLQAQKQLEGLYGVEASVYEVTHENVSGLGDLTALVEQLEQIVELAVDISAYGNGGLHWLHIAFLNEDLFDLLAKDS